MEGGKYIFLFYTSLATLDKGSSTSKKKRSAGQGFESKDIGKNNASIKAKIIIDDVLI
ncbi:MAG: hypothetical protein QXX20_06210 [Candidatus Thermoplasmatota archaeon]